MNRAYSTFIVKAVDDEQRVIDGIASTPSPDRIGDVLEPKGASFALPLPLLWQHNAAEPIGHVTHATVTADGIKIRAQIAKGVLPRIDEAWALIKSGLVRGLSVGFRALDSEPIPHSYALKFKAWEWLELSAVTIPMNADATILAVKQFDVAGPAATRPSPGVPSSSLPAGAGTTRSSSTAMKTASEQITDFQASRTPKAARMTDIMQRAMNEGRTLTTDESTEYDGLAADVKSYDEHIKRLEAFESVQATKAAPVQDARLPRIEVKAPELPPGIEFTRYAMCLMAARGNAATALEIAKSRFPDQRRVQNILKAAVAAGTTTDPTWAGALVPEYPVFAGDFVNYLRPMTIIGKFGTGGIPSLRNVPFNVRIAGQTSGGEGYWVGQGAPKPVTKFDFETTKLGWAKVANIAVLTEELVRFSSPAAEGLVRDALAAALVARLDIDFIDPAKALVADVSPASITNGIAALTPSGTDAAAVRQDIQALITTFLNANMNPQSAVFIMPNTVALAISLMTNALGQPEFPGLNMNGGVLKGIPVITSQYAVLGGSPDGNLVILCNASDIFLSDDGQVVIDASREASLQMDDSPTNTPAGGSPLAPTATTMVSLWQTNSIGLRAERFINWARRRDEAVAYLENVQYSA